MRRPWAHAPSVLIRLQYGKKAVAVKSATGPVCKAHKSLVPLGKQFHSLSNLAFDLITRHDKVDIAGGPRLRRPMIDGNPADGARLSCRTLRRIRSSAPATDTLPTPLLFENEINPPHESS